jgi:hypothetical protein
MKKLKGLWFIGIGLLMLVGLAACESWIALIFMQPPKPPFIVLVAEAIPSAFLSFLVFPPSVFGLFNILAIILVVIGVFRLVCSLRERREEQ